MCRVNILNKLKWRQELFANLPRQRKDGEKKETSFGYIEEWQEVSWEVSFRFTWTFLKEFSSTTKSNMAVYDDFTEQMMRNVNENEFS